LFGAVDSVVHVASRAANARRGSAAVSPKPVRAECGRDGEQSRSSMETCRSAHGIHAALSRFGDMGLSEGRREDIRMRKVASGQWLVVSPLRSLLADG